MPLFTLLLSVRLPHLSFDCPRACSSTCLPLEGSTSSAREVHAPAQVKFNVNRVDNMVIQAIALLDTLDRDINTFVMRVREWYSWHFPELLKVVPDNYQYSRLALIIGDKGSLADGPLPGALSTAPARTRLGKLVVQESPWSIAFDHWQF